LKSELHPRSEITVVSRGYFWRIIC